MPHFPEWFVITCILLPVANLIYERSRFQKRSMISQVERARESGLG